VIGRSVYCAVINVPGNAEAVEGIKGAELVEGLGVGRDGKEAFRGHGGSEIGVEGGRFVLLETV
jgi:hypothetical protein